MEIQLNRIILLVKRHLLKDGKKYITALSAGLVITLIISALNIIASSILNPQVYITISSVLYILGGSILSASIFSELNSQDSGYQLMALPASSLEKFISYWVVSFVLFSIAATAFICLGAAILIAGTSLAGIASTTNLFMLIPIKELILAYAISNAIYLLGGAAFKSAAFIKTVLASGVISLVISGILGIIAWITFRTAIGSAHTISNGNTLINYNGVNMGSYLDGNSEVLGLVSLVLFLLFCWTVTYFKLKEREI